MSDNGGVQLFRCRLGRVGGKAGGEHVNLGVKPTKSAVDPCWAVGAAAAVDLADFGETVANTFDNADFGGGGGDASDNVL
jgi:hypothetical protein